MAFDWKESQGHADTVWGGHNVSLKGQNCLYVFCFFSVKGFNSKFIKCVSSLPGDKLVSKKCRKT